MAREVRIQILGDSRDFSRAVDSANRDASRLDGAFGRVGRGASAMAGAVALGAAGVAVAGGAMALSFIRAAEESQQVTRQTEAVLNSMGATAWQTADAVAGLSKELSNQTGIDDELIQSGQNVLLTFGNVQNRIGQGRDVFDRATRAALDMSVALGQDMNSASMMVGKALNDPIRGLTQLRRVGIQFTAQQEDQIRTMAEAGDIAGAQAVMLSELERQFGGSAAAQSTASQRLSTMWGNLQEDLGGMLLPIFEKVAAWLTDMLPIALWHGTIWFNRFREGIAVIVGWIRDNWPTIQEVISVVMERVQTVVSTVLGYIQGAWDNFGSTILSFVRTAWDAISQIIKGAMEFINGVINVVMGIIHGDWSQVWEGIKGIVNGVWQAINGLIDQAINIVRTTISVGLMAAKGLFENIWNQIVDFVTRLPGRIASAASGMWDGIKNAFRSAINWIIRGWNSLEFTLPALSTPFGEIGGFTLGTPNIPTLHTGGIFRAPSGQTEGLALLQDGERVTSRAQTMAEGGTPLQVTVVLDGQVLADSLIRQARVGNNVVLQLSA